MSDKKQQQKGGEYAQAQSLSFAGKKTERIVTALHLVTNHIKETEPLREAIRRRGVALLSDVRESQTLQDEQMVRRIALSCRELQSLIAVLADAGLISRANADLLISECGDLMGFVVEYAGEQSLFAGYFLSREAAPQLATPSVGSAATAVKDKKEGQRKGQKPAPVSARTHGRKRAPDRERRIVELVRQKGAISVRDVASVITDCSEKTLQRELVRLVEQGVLKKEGERRWSTYRMA